MKKIAVLLFLTSLLWTAAAQKDTVQYLDPWYLFNPLSSRTCYTDYYDSPSAILAYDGFFQIYRDINAKFPVYGIAFVADTVSKVMSLQYGRPDSSFFKAKLFDSIYGFLYWGDSSHPSIHAATIDSAVFDSFTKLCFFKYNYNYIEDVMTYSTTYDPGSRIFPCFELYFDNPIIKEWKNICVGQDYNHNLGDTTNWFLCNRFLKDSSSNTHYRYQGSNADYISVGYLTFRNPDTYNWGGVFPIVRLRCTLPRMVRETGRGSDHLSIAWQNHDDASGFQVAIYPEGTPADSIVPIDVDGTSYTFTGLTPGVHYLYSVRKRCHYATNSYDTIVDGDWYPPQELYFAPSEGIADIGAPRFSLSPNPAGEAVTVTFVEPSTGCRLELYDAAGHRVEALAVPPAATEATLDLRHQAPGIYLLQLLSPAGNAVRKLVVR